MDPVEREMTLRDYWRVIVRRKWLVVLPMVIAAAAALGLSLAQTPVYVSSTEVLVQPRNAGGLFQNQAGGQVSNDRTIQTEIQVFEGETVRLRVQENLGLAERPPEADAGAVGQTDVIRVSVRNTDPTTAQVLADAYAQAYVEIRREQSVNELLAAASEIQFKITEIDERLATLDDADPLHPVLLTQRSTFEQTLDQLQVDAALRTGGASVIKPADLPEVPVEPTPARTAVLAGVVGLLLGLGAAFLVDYTDQTIRDEDDLERITPLPVLAVVPEDAPPDNRPISLTRPEDYAVEAYRGLRTNVQFLGLDSPLKIIQIVSSIAGEGKTTTATNLSVVLAQAGQRVALVDADLRRPRVHEVFSIAPTLGLTHLLLGEHPDLVIQHLNLDEDTRLDVITVGEAPPNPAELLSGRRVKTLLTELAASYDYVILDSAPILPVADSIALASGVDGVLLVAQAGQVSRGNVAEAVERLGRVDAPIVGIVLNRASGADRSGYRYGYGGYGTRHSGRGYGDAYRSAPLAPPVASRQAPD